MPKVGDIGVTPGKTWAMRMIRMGTMSRYGHAAIVSNVFTDGRVEIGEAMPEGFRYRTLPAGSDEFVWLDFGLNRQQRDKVRVGVYSAIGTPYDWWSIFLFILRFWGKKVRSRTDDHADDKLICSEAAVWLYRDFAEVDLFPGFAPGDISPGDIADLWLKNQAHMTWLKRLEN